jgi:UDP-GlcNAc:undecaprenyl-phosphate GlcNAc-1-phosphate transferase
VADKNHVHHKLLGIGLSHREAVLAIYGLQTAFISLAYLLRWQSDLVVLAVYGFLACGVLLLFVRRAGQPFSLSRRQDPDAIAEVGDGPEQHWLTSLPVRLLGFAVPAFLLGSVFLPAQVPADMAYVAIGLFALVLAGLLAMPSAVPMLVRTGLYVGSTFVVYLIEQPMLSGGWDLHAPLNLFFVGLAALIMLTIRFGLKQRFQTTPLDYLMVFLALAIPFLPEMRIGEINLSLLTAKLIVMFLAFELILHALSERLRLFGLVSLWVLFMLGVRAWW